MRLRRPFRTGKSPQLVPDDFPAVGTPSVATIGLDQRLLGLFATLELIGLRYRSNSTDTGNAWRVVADNSILSDPFSRSGIQRCPAPQLLKPALTVELLRGPRTFSATYRSMSARR
jgi:hypothetical protein